MSSLSNPVTLRQGSYSGSAVGAHFSFKGIPYARPPIGELRFALPVRLPDGDQETSATRFGAACAQVSGRPRIGAGRFGGLYSEDCLYLNVFTPAADSAHRPVIVWIHGGAFLLGSANLYDGGQLAEMGDIVVVTINYRLGILGFVDVGALAAAEVPSNLGMHDIVAALHWVRENIAAFGGDPDRITVAGESAGSIAISLLLLADDARGLFRAAIMQSGAINLIHDRPMASATVDAYRKVLGSPSLAQMRAISTRDLLQAQIDAGRALDGAMAASPWYDGALLPDSLAAARQKSATPVKLLAGSTREETALFEKMPGMSVRVDRPFLEEQINRELDRDHAAAILRLYPNDSKGTRSLATTSIFLDRPAILRSGRPRIHPAGSIVSTIATLGWARRTGLTWRSFGTSPDRSRPWCAAAR